MICRRCGDDSFRAWTVPSDQSPDVSGVHDQFRIASVRRLASQMPKQLQVGRMEPRAFLPGLERFVLPPSCLERNPNRGELVGRYGQPTRLRNVTGRKAGVRQARSDIEIAGFEVRRLSKRDDRLRGVAPADRVRRELQEIVQGPANVAQVGARAGACRARLMVGGVERSQLDHHFGHTSVIASSATSFHDGR